MSIHQDKKTGNWIIKIYLGKVDGKKKYKTVSAKSNDREKALAIESTLLAAKKSVKLQSDLEKWSQVVADVAGVERDYRTMSLKILKDEWIKSDNAGSLADSTFKTRLKSVKFFMTWLNKEMPALEFVHQVTLDVAVMFKDYLKVSNRGGRTINNYLQHLRGVWRGVMHKAGAVNVWNDVQPVPTANRGQGAFDRRALSSEEFELVYDRAVELGREWCGLVLFGVYSGLRLGDCIRLNRDCFRDDVLVTVPGKTAKHGVKVFIPLHSRLSSWLNNHNGFNLFPELAIKYGSGDMQRELRYIFDAVVDPQYKISFHCLRHTFRSWISEAGATLEQAKRLCGHLTDEMSLRYNHESATLKTMIEKL